MISVCYGAASIFVMAHNFRLTWCQQAIITTLVSDAVVTRSLAEFYTLHWQQFKHWAFELNKAILVFLETST